MRESRTEKRTPFDNEQRLVLLEQDADQFEDGLVLIQKQLSKLTWVAVAGLISFSTATVLLAIDISTRMG